MPNSTSVNPFDDLYSFTNRLIVSLKTRSNILTRDDFLKIRNVCPDGYGLAMDVYKGGNMKIRNLPSVFGNAMEIDFKKYENKGIDSKLLNFEFDNLSIHHKTCLTKAQDFIEGLKIADKISDLTVLPISIITGFACSSIMYGYSSYIQLQVKKQKVLVESRDLFEFFEPKRTEHIMKENNEILLNEFTLGVGEAILVAIGFIYLQASIAYVLGVDLKRKWDILKYALPGVVSMTILSVLMAIVVNTSIF